MNIHPESAPLGFGLGFRPPHYRHIVETKPPVDWFEVVTENFLGGGGRPRYFLDQLRQNYPIVLHGVGLSIASTDPINKKYLERLREMLLDFEPQFVSDHLCWTTHGRHNSHDLLPLPYTTESLQHVAERVAYVQDYLGRRIFLENPSAYVAFAGNEMSEAEFLRELSITTGCGVLLDINNLFVNHCNLAFDVDSYLQTLPANAVGQFHLAGHSIEEKVRIDTHDHPICDEVWDLYQRAVRLWPDVPTLVEWDDHIPPFAELAQVLTRAKAEHSQAERSEKVRTLISTPRNTAHAPRGTLQQTQLEFLRLITNPTGVEDGANFVAVAANLPVPASVGLNVYNNAYFSRLRDAMKGVYSGLAFIVDDDGFDHLVAQYLSSWPPSDPTITRAGAQFAEFLRRGELPHDFGVEPRVLADIALLEWTKIEIFDAPDEGTLVFSDLINVPGEVWESLQFDFATTLRPLKLCCDAKSVLDAIDREQTPDRPEIGDYRLIVFRTSELVVQVEHCSEREYRALAMLMEGGTFQAMCEAIQSDTRAGMEQSVQSGLEFLRRWLDWGLITGFRGEKVSPLLGSKRPEHRQAQVPVP